MSTDKFHFYLVVLDPLKFIDHFRKFHTHSLQILLLVDLALQTAFLIFPVFTGDLALIYHLD
jgi:hypothetical protein